MTRTSNLLTLLLAITLAGGSLALRSAAQTAKPQVPKHNQSASIDVPPLPAAAFARSAQANTYLESVWGIQILGVRDVSSGSMLRFSYRVVDPEKAAVLNDKKWNPFLVDEVTGLKLGVPSMDQVGLLRQTAKPEAGHDYWMIFGNPGGVVRPGSRVDVVIGAFHAEGLQVE